MRHIEVRLFEDKKELPFDEFVLEQDEDNNNSKLIVKNAIFHHRQLKRQFGTIKVHNNNELPYARQMVGSEKILQLEQQMRNQLRIIEHLERRTSSFHYNPGEIQRLTLNGPNNKGYQVRNNSLYRKALTNSRLSRQGRADFEMSKLDKVNQSIISTQPIDQNQSIVSFQITLQKSSTPKSKPFIGLCIKNPKSQQDIFLKRQDKFEFLIPKGSHEEIENLNDQSISTVKKSSLCDLYYLQNSSARSYLDNMSLKARDSLVMTVDLKNYHITWYRNEKCLERSYFELSDNVDIYPFVYLEPEAEATF